MEAWNDLLNFLSSIMERQSIKVAWSSANLFAVKQMRKSKQNNEF